MMRLGSRRLMHLAPAERQTAPHAPDAGFRSSARASHRPCAAAAARRFTESTRRRSTSTPHRVNRHQAIPPAVRSRSNPNHGDKDEPRSGLHHTPPDCCSIDRHPSQGCSPAATACTTPAVGHRPPRDGILGGKKDVGLLRLGGEGRSAATLQLQVRDGGHRARAAAGEGRCAGVGRGGGRGGPA